MLINLYSIEAITSQSNVNGKTIDHFKPAYQILNELQRNNIFHQADQSLNSRLSHTIDEALAFAAQKEISLQSAEP